VRTLFPPRGQATAADALAIVVFATIGLISHHHGISFRGYARDAAPVLGGWFVAAMVFRLYVRPSAKALIGTWAVGVTAGVLVRALALGRALNGKEATFLTVALISNLVFVVGLRAVASLVRR